MSKSLKFLLIDDHRIVTKGLARILKEEYGFATVHEAQTTQDALRYLSLNQYDLAVLDVKLVEGSSLVFFKEIRELYPDLPVVILSMIPTSIFSKRYMNYGARGCLNKSADETEILNAIRKVLAGGLYEDDSGVKGKGAAHKSSFSALSDRETEVMLLLLDGLGLTEIGNIMNLKITTVSTY